MNEKGTPIAPESKVRSLYLLGNAKEDFQQGYQQGWRVSLTGNNMAEEYESGRPVTCQAIRAKKEGSDTVYTNRDFRQDYGLRTDTFGG